MASSVYDKLHNLDGVNFEDLNITDDVVIGDDATISDKLTVKDISVSGALNNSAGTLDISSSVNLSSTAGALRLNNLTTAQRDALTGQDGMVLYNSTENELQQYKSSAWSSIGSGGGGGSGTKIYLLAYNNATQTIGHNTNTQLTFNQTEYSILDSRATWSGNTFTLTSGSGYFHVRLSGNSTTNSSGYLERYITRLTGNDKRTWPQSIMTFIQQSDITDMRFPVDGVIFLDSSDSNNNTLEFGCMQTSGTNITVGSSLIGRFDLYTLITIKEL